VNVLVNGERRRLPDGATIAALLEQLDLNPGRRGVAVAVDAEVVPRSGWPETELTDGARVEVLTAIQGG
jgi:sulfur carrier protein